MKTKTKYILCAMISLFVAVSLIGVFLFSSRDTKADNSETVEVMQTIVGGTGEDTGAAYASVKEKGGAIYVSKNSEYKMSNGTLHSHRNVYGGAVYVASGGKFTMTGGLITDCEATYGGAIYVESGGTCTITGGEIMGNRSSTAAIYLEQGATLKISDTSLVHDNEVLQKYTINIYADGVVVDVKTVISSEFNINEQKLSLGLDKCCGYFFDSDCKVVVPEGVVDLKNSGYVNDGVVNLYTKTATVNDFIFVLNEEAESYGCSLNSSGLNEEVVIPAQYNKLPVSEVIACTNSAGITKVILASSITSIGDNAFNGAASIKNIDILDCVTNIGEYAFNGCKGLTSIKLPEDLENIGEGAFKGCTKLTGTLIIPEGITKIASDTFYDCESYTKIILPSGLKSIASGAFSRCKSITSIDLPETLTTLGSSAFSYCNNLRSVEIPEGITKLGSSTFTRCYGLQSVVIPDTVTEISSYVFSNCSNLTDVEIPSSVTKISIGAFQSCSSLESMLVPSSVLTLGANVFSGCTSMETIYCEHWPTPEGWNEAWYGDCEAEIIWGYGISAEIQIYVDGTLSKTLTVSSDYTINEVDMPLSYEECCGYFLDQELTIAAGDVVEINSLVVNLYTKTAVVSTGTTFTLSDDQTYYTLNLPNESGSDAPTFAAKSLNTASTKDIVMPKEYNGLPVKGVNAKGSGVRSFVFNDEIEILGDSAFNNCGSLISINIPSNVTSISDKAFYYCTDLSGVTIGENVNNIGDSVFAGCNELSSIIVPDSVTSLGESAFYECYNLTSVTLSKNLVEILTNTFFGCSNLTSIVIPSLVRSVNDGAFEYCSRLASVEFNNGLTYIGKSAFKNCVSLTSVDLPSSVTTIDERVFYDCTELTKIYIRMGVTSIGANAFYNVTNAATMYCEAAREPASWDSSWDVGCRATIFWGTVFERTIFIYVDGELSKTMTIEKGVLSYAIREEDMPLPYENCCGYFLNEELTETIKDGIIDLSDGDVNLYTKTASDLSSFTFTFNSSTGTFDIKASSTSISGEIVIPEEYNNSRVALVDATSYTNGAFYNCKSITSIVLPDSVTSIGDWVFCNCSGLTRVTIGNSVESIGDWAFYNCSRLTSIEIPDSVTSIGNYAFYYCSGLTSIEIPDSVTSIGNQAFHECSGLTSIYIPSSVKTISASSYSSSPFNYCSSTMVIYCGAASKPTGWGTYWNYYSDSGNLQVVWGKTRAQYEAAIGASAFAPTVEYELDADEAVVELVLDNLKYAYVKEN